MIRNVLILLCVCLGFSIFAQEPKKPNVLFIAIDDLRPELGCYGAPVYSPNIDKLASQGVLFQHHYVQMAVCIPSRAALLTGLRSERTQQVYGPTVWNKVPGAKTWGKTFKQGGYTTASFGKIWHVEEEQHPDTFDVEFKSKKPYYINPDYTDQKALIEELKAQGYTGNDLKRLARPITECLDVPDNAYPDGDTAEKAIDQLRTYAQQKEPFMLAVGFIRPHLPFVSPKKYWDLYNENDIELAPNTDFPKNMPEVAFSHHPNFFSYRYGDYEPLKEGKKMNDRTARHLRHAYRAATSYIDAQVGKVLDELKNLELDKSTIVVLWSDHGFMLGDTGHWSKQCNFEMAARSPLIIKVPWMKTMGSTSAALVETVDLFPTLLDLCHLPELTTYDGKTLTPLLEDPKRQWSEAAFHIFNRERDINGEKRGIVGYAVRTDRYRLVSWRLGWGLDKPEYATELYDYEEDPYETINLVDDAKYSKIKKHLEQLLKDGPAGQNSF